MFSIFSALASVATIAGSAFSAYSSYQQQQEQAEYQQEVAERNARLRQQQMERQAEATVREQMDIRKRGEAVKGRQESLLAGSGVTTTSGSPMDLLAETASDIEYDVEMAEYQGQLQQTKLKRQKQASETRADFMGSRARQAGKAKILAPITRTGAGLYQDKQTPGGLL